jgi:hypothetical protein
MDVARRGLYQLLVHKQLRLFVAALRLISIPKGEVIDEQVQALVHKRLRIFMAVLRPISIPTCEVIYEQVQAKRRPSGWGGAFVAENSVVIGMKL